MHGSCRRPYAAGLDSVAAADTLLGRDPSNIDSVRKGRPAILAFTGDQIYADDIDASLFAIVQDVGRRLIGYQEELPTAPSHFVELDKLTWGKERREFVLDKIHFTTDDGEGHILGLSEFAAMYVLNWNQTAWPADAVKKLPDERWQFGTPCGDDPRKPGARVKDLYRSLPAVQRALANVPTYMIFDDHDVTDDWNIDEQFYDEVSKSVPGRRTVANALAAYWLFQAWGNDPDSFELPPAGANPVRDAIEEFCAYQSSMDGRAYATNSAAKRYEDTLWQFDGWMFTAPTDPITVFADTRTNRELFRRGTGPNLINTHGRAKLKQTAEGGGYRSGKPIIIVSAAPVFGLLVMEWIQKKKIAHGTSALEMDMEQWRDNQTGQATFLRFIVERIAPEFCVFLSGDVHYGFSAGVDYVLDPSFGRATFGRYVRFIQLTASALKNESPKVGKYLLPKGLPDNLLSDALGVIGVDNPIDVTKEDWWLVDDDHHPPAWTEFGRYYRDDGGEAAAPIQGRSNLGVVTILPGARTLQHDFCQIYQEETTAPKIVELSAQIPVRRVVY